VSQGVTAHEGSSGEARQAKKTLGFIIADLPERLHDLKEGKGNESEAATETSCGPRADSLSATPARLLAWAGPPHEASGAFITRQMMSQWTKVKGVIVRGGDVDESPHVYRPLPDVLAAQGSTIEVLHTLTPLVVVMAGAGEVDPYKD
jgi:hypothetical protein